jgi:phosphatidate cytidylyltransferase
VNNFLSRTITGALIVAVMLAAIAINEYTFFIVFLAILIGGLIEFYTIFEKAGKTPQKNSGIALGVILFTLMFITAKGFDVSLLPQLNQVLIILVVVSIVIYEIYRKKPSPFENIALTLLGVIYIALPLSLLWLISFRENIYNYNPHLILGFFFIIWTYDSMAYVTGMMFGKRKLFERISPKKSWEGAIGGFVFSIAVAIGISFFFTELTAIKWVIFAIIVSVLGTYGDLAESLLKRSANIKDSGTILPGHGGLLDRFDALFLAIPVVYLYLQFV